jgi:hypothetical protein
VDGVFVSRSSRAGWRLSVARVPAIGNVNSVYCIICVYVCIYGVGRLSHQKSVTYVQCP